MNGKQIRILIPVSFFTGCFILFIPLLREFHIELAIFGALAGSVWGILAGRNVKTSAYAALKAPFIGLTVFALPSIIRVLITGCFSVDGLGYWLLYPYPSILLWFYLTRYLSALTERPALFSAIICFIFALPLFLMEAWLFPQVFFHNHVWGGWPGPIYDQQLQLDDSVFFFRSMTLLWAFIFYVMTSDFSSRWRLGFISLAALSLMISYSNMSENRIISPEQFIQKELGGMLGDDHIILIYPEDDISSNEAANIHQRLTFHTSEISEILETELSQPIKVFVYRDAWQKLRYTGAKFTNYVPVWTRNPQVHINFHDVERVARHELVHAVAREFGNRTLNASWSIGMVEGLAVAIAPDYNRQATAEQMLASTNTRPDKSEIKSLFSLTGFYSGRGPMNYAISGAFIKYLIEQEDISVFKKAYRKSDLSVYENLDQIISGWHTHLDGIPYTEEAQIAGERIFSIPSIFEEHCPRKMSHYDALLDQYRFATVRGDTVAIYGAIDSLLRIQPDEQGWNNYLIRNLNFNRPGDEISISPFEIPRTAPIFLRASDVAALRGEWELAQQYLELALYQEPSLLDSDFLTFRSDQQIWQNLISAQYEFHKLSFDAVLDLPENFQTIAINRAVSRQRSDVLLRWSQHENFAETVVTNHDAIPFTLRHLLANEHSDIFLQIYNQLPMDELPEVTAMEVRELKRYHEFSTTKENINARNLKSFTY